MIRPKTGEGGLDLSRELEAWRMVFEVGSDYFDGLREVEILDSGFDRDLVDHRAIAQEAWTRLRSHFLAQRRPDPYRPIPWAMLSFDHSCPICKGRVEEDDEIPDGVFCDNARLMEYHRQPHYRCTGSCGPIDPAMLQNQRTSRRTRTVKNL